MRRNFVLLSTLLIVVTLLFAIYLSPNWYVVLGIIFLLTLLGYYDMFQKKHSVMRIYPVLGRLRFLLSRILMEGQ